MLPIIESLTTGALFLLSFLIFTNPRGVNKKANLWLSAFTFCIFYLLLDSLFELFNLYPQYPHVIGTAESLYFLITPILYFAVLNYVTPDRAFKSKDLYHFILFFIFILLQSPFYIRDGASKLKISEEDTATVTDYIIFSILLMQVFTYIGLSIKKVNRHQKNLQLVLSSGDTVNLMWLKYLLICFLGMVLIWGMGAIIITDFYDFIEDIAYLFIVLPLAYYALHQDEVYSFNKNEKEAIRELIEANENHTEIKKQYIPAEDLKKMTQKLADIMETEKPYLDNDLNLLKLASQLNTSIHVLSYVINEGYGENFAQFVNRHRVEAAKNLLDNPESDHLSILGIAYDAGFNSKTAFNTTFKKITGLSPSEYKSRRSIL